jgi:hypothetical protein
MRFYLGVHMPQWVELTSVPLFLSNARLAARRHLPRACGPWALDSGGYTEIRQHGRWRSTPAQYAAQARRYAQEMGNLC